MSEPAAQPVQALPILSPPMARVRLPAVGRLAAGALAAACLGVLLAAAYLAPDPAGVGTETRLGLEPCGFKARTGLPCAGCGLTTSFNHAVRWQWLKSLWVQPMGTLLTLATAAAFWIASFIAATGQPIHRTITRGFAGREARWIVGLVAFGIAAWGLKIAQTLLGVDGTNW